MTATPRRIALEILNKADKKGAHAKELLRSSFESRLRLSYQEKAFITELVYGILRWRDSIDWVIKQFSTFPHRRISRQIRNILRIGIYQILYLDNIPVQVSVDATVELVKALTNKKMASMVNGLLRNVERNRDRIAYPTLREDPVRAIALRYSHPVWLVEKWLQQYGVEETISLCKTNNTPPPFTIRTNTLKVTRQRLLENLQKEEVSCDAAQYSPEGIILYCPSDITRFSSFKKGWFFVQDEGAQLIAHLVDPKPEEQVLDLCTAPGGKSTHMAQLMNNQGRIVAIDISLEKIELMKENQSRLGTSIIEVVVADSACRLPFKQGQRFDKVLLDVPCSGLGVLRRHPEGKWIKSVETISTMKRIQWEIILQASRFVKPGGVMVYSTCTLTAEENGHIVKAFLSIAGDTFQIDTPRVSLTPQLQAFIDSSGYFQTFPHRDSMDGFFGVRLRKTK